MGFNAFAWTLVALALAACLRAIALFLQNMARPGAGPAPGDAAANIEDAGAGDRRRSACWHSHPGDQGNEPNPFVQRGVPSGGSAWVATC